MWHSYDVNVGWRLEALYSALLLLASSMSALGICLQATRSMTGSLMMKNLRVRHSRGRTNTYRDWTQANNPKPINVVSQWVTKMNALLHFLSMWAFATCDYDCVHSVCMHVCMVALCDLFLCVYLMCMKYVKVLPYKFDVYEGGIYFDFVFVCILFKIIFWN